MAIKTMKLMADFETTTDPEDCRVWACGAVDIDKLEVAYIGNSLDHFMDWLSGMNTKVLWHNLRFDGEFVLHWLLSHGYRWDKGKDDRGFRTPLKEKHFRTLITDEGLFYSIEICFRRISDKKMLKATLQDSLKKLPFSVAQIAKGFKLSMSKGEIDYDAPRPVGHELTPEEKDYLIRDCMIVAEALKVQFDQGLTRMTNASDAMDSYKKSVGGNFDKWFPVLPLELDANIRKAYKGGYVYLNPKYKGVRGLQGKTYDVNSLYPSRMYEEMLPFGYPVYFENDPEPDDIYPLYIIHFKCTFELKPDHLPTIQLKGNGRFVETEYLTTSRVKEGNYWTNDPVEMWITSVDYALMMDHYEVKFYPFDDGHYSDGFKFRGAVGMFKNYIDYWMHIKETETGPKRQLAKLQLNSLYGRFALNPKTCQKIPYLDEDGVVRYKYGEEEYRDPVYCAMGCFITAYSRNLTIRSAQELYDVFVYADTDSLHICTMEEPEGLEIHPTRLGAWALESTWVDSVFLRAKTYMESEQKHTEDSLRNYAKLLCKPFVHDLYREPDGIHYRVAKVTCAGMPDNVKEQVTYDNFRPGAVFEGKLMPKRVPGGIVLEERTFTIK